MNINLFRIAARVAANSVILSTDKSLAHKIRSVLFEKIQKLVPDVFPDKLYDTKEEGKGFRGGYISFAADPKKWEADHIIGGILFQCTYDKKAFRSEEPENVAGWKGHSQGGGLLVLNITACYYNKRLGGGCANLSSDETDFKPVSLGVVEFLLDGQEQIISVNVVDPSTLTTNLTKLVDSIHQKPPDEALGSRRKKKGDPKTHSPKSLTEWLLKNGRDSVDMSEIESLSRAMSDRTDTAYGTMLQRNINYFRQGMWRINHNA